MKGVVNKMVFPGHFYCDKNLLLDIGKYFKFMGSKQLIIGGSSSLSQAGEKIKQSFEENGMEAIFEPFNGICTYAEIDRVAEICKQNDIKSIVGVGGGSCIDTAKAVANKIGGKVGVVPTIASNDAPCSALSVVYNEDHAVVAYEFFENSPNVVFVDTQIIAQAPTRFLIGGIGDAMATFFEAQQVSLGRKPNCCGGVGTMTALALSNLCYDTLIEYAEEAIIANNNNVVTPAFNKVVEANILLSGIGFESGGIAVAHAVHNGLTELHETASYQHGEKVNIGTLTQLVLQNASNELLRKIYKFSYDVGLPMTLSDIGVENPTEEDLMKVSVRTCDPNDTAINMPFKVTPDMIKDALVVADGLGKKFKEEFSN